MNICLLSDYSILDVDEGLKYLGFYLKPNDYRKDDLKWLVSKIEKRLKVRCHQWLLRAGRLVMVKSVPEAIPIYWLSLPWIPIETLEKIHWLCL